MRIQRLISLGSLSVSAILFFSSSPALAMNARCIRALSDQDANTVFPGFNRDMNHFESLLAKVQETKPGLERDAARTQFLEAADGLRAKLASVGKVEDTERSVNLAIEEYNGVVIEAGAKALKRTRWYNPFEDSEILLSVEDVLDRLIFDESKPHVQLPVLCELAGRAADYGLLAFYSDIVPHITTRYRFDIALYAIRAHYSVMPFLRNVVGQIKTRQQFEAVKMGIQIGFDSLLYYDLALKVRSDAQVEEFRRVIRAGAKNLYAFRNIINR
jgi:hypothetical protein